MPTQKDIAEFHRVSINAVKKWSKQKQAERKVELLAGIDLDVQRLIGEISRMVYLYNCQNIEGVKQVAEVRFELNHFSLQLHFSNYTMTAYLDEDSAKVRLESMLLDLKQFIYTKVA